MKKSLLILGILINLPSLNAQEILLTHKDISYFVDTISFELKDQLPTGVYKVYYDSLKTTLDCIGEISSGKRVGNWIWYYDSGVKKREVSYQDGKINGSDISYYPNGQQSVKINFIEGIQNGVTNGWYLNGTKMFEGMYSNGFPTGTWKYYNEDGTLAKEEQYQ